MATIEEAMDLIRKDIKENYERGDRYKTVVEIKGHFGFARSTTIKAMAELSFMGIIRASEGRGYWVR